MQQLGQERILFMKYETFDISTRLRIADVSECEMLDEIPIDFEDQRDLLEERARIEEFWAGRNLADRNSTRKAA